MRKLSDRFLDDLHHGFLSPLRERVIKDQDLDLHIREGYINIYYKGNALLKLDETKGRGYRTQIHHKFVRDLDIGSLVDEETSQKFVEQIPIIKENIVLYGKSSLEIEYEQLFIRANNLERRNNSEYFVIDRQYAIGGGRFDLISLFWDRQNRRKHQTVPLCFMEVKFGLNNDIVELHEQLARYYDSIQRVSSDIAEEQEAVFRQKLELGLFNKSEEQLNAMKTLRVSRDVDSFQFIIILIDYNPHSRLFGIEALSDLPFASQVHIWRAGFALWSQSLTPIQPSMSGSTSLNTLTEE